MKTWRAAPAPGRIWVKGYQKYVCVCVSAKYCFVHATLRDNETQDPAAVTGYLLQVKTH